MVKGAKREGEEWRVCDLFLGEVRIGWAVEQPGKGAGTASQRGEKKAERQDAKEEGPKNHLSHHLLS